MTQQTMLTIKNKSEVLYLRQDNILFIQADGNYCNTQQQAHSFVPPSPRFIQ